VSIHWTSYAFLAVAVGCIGAGKAQVSIHPKDMPTQPLPGSAPIRPAVVLPDIPEPKKVVTATITPNALRGLGPARPPGEPVVLRYEPGGMIGQHRLRFLGYQREGSRVELRGGCYSACTLITGYVPKDKLCIEAGAFLAFHSALMRDYKTANMAATLEMYLTYPKDIRDWIDINGGPTQLTPTGWWVLYDRDLWAMGYPKCK